MSIDDAHTTVPRFISIDEAADLLRLNRKTLYDMAGRRKLPGCRKFGNRYRIDRAVLLGSFRAEHPRSRSE